MYHALALLLVGLLFRFFASYTLVASGWSFIGGTLLFSGSLYLLSTRSLFAWQSVDWLGPVTPIGGLLLIGGWGLLLLTFLLHWKL
jgi:uncharacterized membrane protein YgdD (TMEM256/DUF423 family)